MRAKLNGTEIFFDVDGAGLSIDDGKLASRKTIIAIHGGPGFDHGYLRPGLGPLRDDAQIVYVDLRGQGRSGRPPVETCTLEQYADDVASLAEHLGIEKPVVFGHSAGGFVALTLALRHPKLAGGLITCCSSPKFGTNTDDGPVSPPLASRATPEVAEIATRFFGGDWSIMQEFSEKVSPYYAGPKHLDVPPRLHALTTTTTEVMAHFFMKLAKSYDVREKLGTIAVPTLVIAGAWDWVTSQAGNRAIARGIPNAEIVMLEESGHYAMSEEPEKFLAAVRAFLKNRVARAPSKG